MANQHDSPRYARQIRVAAIGAEGQARLQASRVLIVGLGALGSVAGELLARAGAGLLRLVDRDFVEITNLQRQLLYTEEDARLGLPKAICAAQRLQAINSTIAIEPHVADATARTIEPLAQDIDLIIDGTDNFETRFLINDLAVARGMPWIFGGCLGCDGQAMNIIPGETACLSCLMPDGPPAAGEMPTCDTAGVLGPIVTIVASWQVTEAIKYLTGNPTAMSRALQVFSLWDNRMQSLSVPRRIGSSRSSPQAGESCPTCVDRRFPWLLGERGSESVVLCGRNSVQLNPEPSRAIDLTRHSEKLRGLGTLQVTPYFLRLQLDAHELTLFPDGRAIISGTDQPAIAKSLYARYVGQ